MSGARKIEVNATSLFYNEISLNTKTTTKTKILHVDDDPCILQVSKDILEMEDNFEVDSALSVDEAVKKMKAQSYDAVISDYEMPQKNGLQFLKELRQQKNEIPFILFTGKGREEVAINALNLGADGYINKIGDTETVYGELSHGIRLAAERMKAKSALEESEKRYRTLMEQATETIFVHDINGQVVDVNQQACKSLGYTKKELLSMNIADLDAEATENEKGGLFWPKVLAGQSVTFESTHKRKDGSTFPVEVNLGSTTLGKETAVIGLVRDTTERKKMMNALRESEEKYRTVFENTGAATCILEEDKTISLVNKQFEKLSGYSKEEIEGKKKWTEFVTKEYVEKMKEYHRKRRKKGNKAPKHYTFDAVNKKGEIRNMLLTIDVIPGTKKTVASLIDITEPKQMKEQLRELEKKYQSIIEQAPDSIITFDLNGVVTSANTAALEMAGFSKDEVIGKHFSELSSLHEEDIQKFAKLRDTLLERKVPKPFEVSFLRKDGTTVFGEAHVSMLKEGGRITGFQAVMRDITERNRMDIALQKSNERFKQVMEHVEEFVWEIDAAGVYTYVSSVVEKMLGYTPEEVVGKKRFYDFFHPDDEEELKKKAFSVLDKKDSFKGLINRNVARNGSIVWLSTSGVPIVADDGKLLGYRGVDVNITERKKAEEALRESEEKYRTQFEEALDAIFLADVETGVIIDCNRAASELVGREKSELVGKHQRILHPPEKIEGEFSRTFKQHLKEKEGQVLEAQVITKNGELRDVAIKANAFELAGRRVLQGIFRDITEQKKAEKALREAEEKYRETIVNANVGIIAYDPKGEVKILNPKMEEITGFTSREIPTLTKWFEKLYPNEEERRKVRDKWFKRMSEEGEVKEGHAIITTKEGKRRNFLFNGFQLKSGDFIAFAQDITERKEAEEKLDKLMNELVLVNEKLNVVGGLTRHDVRNKLCAVTGNAFLLKKRHGDQADIMDGLSKMEQAVKDSMEIFEFAKMYEQLGVEELKYVDAEKTINEAVALFSGLNFKVVNDCHGLSLLADSFLRQLIYNFIDNTRKYGEKTTAIRVYFEKAEQGELRLVYEDDGVGISVEDKLKLFTEGFSTGGSTGFGLFLTKKMMDVYGWQIQEAGEPGKGAKFTITIPRINQSGKESFQIIL